MSAYLVSPQEIGLLAQAIVARSTEHGDAIQVARTLAAENLRSVGYRYEMGNAEASRYFCGIKLTQYREAYRNSAQDSTLLVGHNAASLRDLADTYVYQASECLDWPETNAAKAIAVLTEIGNPEIEDEGCVLDDDTPEIEPEWMYDIEAVLN